jgi:hypothetical protein
MSTQHTPGPVCRLPSGRIVGCEYINGDPSTSLPHPWQCKCDRCEPEKAAQRERVRDAAPDLLAALRAYVSAAGLRAIDRDDPRHDAARTALAKAVQP